MVSTALLSFCATSQLLGIGLLVLAPTGFRIRGRSSLREVTNPVKPKSPSDIVERLRDSMINVSHRDRLIAADEIERLRQALSGLVRYLETYSHRNYEEENYEEEDELLGAARAALKRKGK
jgi:hypothetical protein